MGQAANKVIVAAAVEVTAVVRSKKHIGEGVAGNHTGVEHLSTSSRGQGGSMS